jgi:hypothetical protein
MMKISDMIKGALMVIAGVTVVPIVDWFGDLQDKERLKHINKARRKRGQPPFATLWDYYTSQRNIDEGHH